MQTIQSNYSELKNKHRAIWASGDYSEIAHGIQGVADHLVRAARIRPGERVLDVACGTGNTALAAAARGAEVTGLDLTPELISVASMRGLAEGYPDIDWHVGDCEQLPYADGAFDVLTSSCGLMFAPDQPQVAAEVARVVRPGGRVAIHAWTAESGVGAIFRLAARYAPPPAGIASPFAWGDAAHVRGLLGKTFTDFRHEAHDCPEFADSAEELADFWISMYGPTLRTVSNLPADKAALFRNDLIGLFDRYVTPADGKVRWGREYLITIATRR